MVNYLQAYCTGSQTQGVLRKMVGNQKDEQMRKRDEDARGREVGGGEGS